MGTPVTLYTTTQSYINMMVSVKYTDGFKVDFEENTMEAFNRDYQAIGFISKMFGLMPDKTIEKLEFTWE